MPSLVGQNSRFQQYQVQTVNGLQILPQQYPQPQTGFDIEPGKYCSLPLAMIKAVLGNDLPWINELPNNVIILQENLNTIPPLVERYHSFFFILTVFALDYSVPEVETRDMPPYLKTELSHFMGPNPKSSRFTREGDWLNYFGVLNKFIAIHGGRSSMEATNLVGFVKRLVRKRYIDSAFIYNSMNRSYEQFRLIYRNAHFMNNVWDFAVRLGYVRLLSDEQLDTGFIAHKRAVPRKRQREARTKATWRRVRPLKILSDTNYRLQNISSIQITPQNKCMHLPTKNTGKPTWPLSTSLVLQKVQFHQ
ncbi:hypothetical protein F5Y00DRAFT_265103 [Daldinia vernicosa]|uniref:uncharacterized protein n=1 Tax=Daldinia vernicosa TaxID=114800 RepID=UPI002008E89F|nr:uncharacterized protein F5Y00DRAFT_265103 [Daldinia vernicosa]KAI0845920.1 hypothetical protein F5Y00DRAFT_265103 [Daldinia vernicosa]